MILFISRNFSSNFTQLILSFLWHSLVVAHFRLRVYDCAVLGLEHHDVGGHLALELFGTEGDYHRVPSTGNELEAGETVGLHPILI